MDKKKKKEQGLLPWRSCYLFLQSFVSISLKIPTTKHTPHLPPISASPDSTENQQQQQQLLVRERRQPRNERRESKAGYNWREEVEERLIKKKKNHRRDTLLGLTNSILKTWLTRVTNGGLFESRGIEVSGQPWSWLAHSLGTSRTSNLRK